MYLIENPQKTTLETNWRQQKYPFQQMDIGEYFLVPKTEVKQSSLAASASWASKKFGKKFITETFGEFTKVTRVKKPKKL
ncbi:MAG TPA: hypothetical protein PKC44_10650 [Agitococcus sp.]|nr:hypothetical protein [Agitococcus sp.]